MGGFFGKPKFPRSNSSPSADQSSKNGPSSLDNANSRYLVTPFVFKRWSSMYIDEDGDVAHEFYVEPRKNAGCMGSAKTLRKVETSRLRPQGYVDYEIPRLNPSIPYIMVEMEGFSAAADSQRSL